MRASERSLQFAGGTLGGQRHICGSAAVAGGLSPRRLLHLLTVTGALAPASTALSQAPKLPGLVQEGAYDAGNLGMEMQPAPRNDDASAVYAVAAWPTYTPHSPMATERRLSRASAVSVTARPTSRCSPATDDTVVQQIRAVTNSRATYGYRRVWAMVNRVFRTRYNRKRIRRVMQLHGLMLAPRVHRHHGRPHLGQIQQPTSNQRWCSDVFLIPCWSGEVVSVAFAIDSHDREVPAFVASPRPLTGADIRTLMDRTLWARFGAGTQPIPG